jgi:hypothetical protein
MIQKEQVMDKMQRKDMIEEFGGGYDDLIEAVMDIPKEAWDFKSSPERWSITEIIIHVVDSEAHGFIRCRAALAEPGKTIMAYDQTGWASKLAYEKRNPDDYLELFKWLRITTYDMIKNLPDNTWANAYNHPERGSESLDNWLTIYVNHTANHIKQILQTYEEWKKQ